MITNLDQLKNFIMWCKDQKVKKMNIGDIQFEISELDFIPEETGTPMTASNLGNYNTETLVDTLEDSIDPKNDPDLFWSSNT
jgi:hypothetical protein